MRRAFLAVVLLLGALVAASPLHAQDSQSLGRAVGASVRVMRVRTGALVYGRLDIVRADTVFLSRSGGGRRVIPWSSVRRLDARDGKQTSRPAMLVGGMVVGSLGAGAGTVAGLIASLGEPDQLERRVSTGAVVGFALGGAVGVALGSLVKEPRGRRVQRVPRPR